MTDFRMAFREVLYGRWSMNCSTSSLFAIQLGSLIPLTVWACRADAFSQIPDDPATAVATQPTESPVVFLARTDEWRTVGRYEEAVDQYRSLLEAPTVSLKALLGLVACYHQTGRYEEAIAELGKALQNPPTAESADLYTARAENLAALGRYEEANADLRAALKLNDAHIPARYLLGHLLETTGRRDEALMTYKWFQDLLVNRVPETAPDITATGKGFQRFCELSKLDHSEYVLNELFQTAYVRVDRTYWPARVAGADLLRSKYKLEEAAEDYAAALGINPNAVDAHVGLAEAALASWDFDGVERFVEAALAVNPRSVPAMDAKAELRIIERRFDDALATANAALEINPNDLRALSVAAAAARVKGDTATSDSYQARVRAVNFRCALLHSTLADALSGLRQFAEAEREYRTAIEYEPTDPYPRNELGLMYMQWGKEREARLELEAAWDLDNHNDRTHNTLDLLDELDAFTRHETAHFIICYDPESDPGLGRYFADYLESIYKELCADYGIKLEDKTIIEIFPTHRKFGVRITGKPWIYTVGASTGRVIAMDSPRPGSQTMGPYHYAHVLRHEFTHTVTLAATHNRIAHWFTEGLAVLQEDSPRSLAWCELLADAIRRDRLFTLQSVDWGFIRPRKPTDRTLAYAQSEWMCEYLVERFGYDVLNRMIAGFRDGLTQERVFQEVVGLSTTSFDADFAAWARKQAATWGLDLTPPENVEELRAATQEKPDDPDLQARLANAELDDGNYERSITAARKALSLKEDHPLALATFALVWEPFALEETDEAERRHMEDDALPILERLAKIVPTDRTAPRVLGAIYLRREQWDEAAAWFQKLQQVSPRDPASYRGLSGIYLHQDKKDEALAQLLELARTEDHDADVPERIADIFAGKDRLGEARYWYLQAIYINPFKTAPHEKLAAVFMRSGDPQAALEEYLTLTAIQPASAAYISNVALTYQKLGKTEDALAYARSAVALDPSTPASSLLPAPP